ncbi:MAG: DUF4231 domain-containing protein [Ktedonobacteraceae bacterium]
MQTTTDEPKSREDIEAQIEECQEIIYGLRHGLRWFTFIARVFCLCVAVIPTVFILAAFMPLLVQNILDGVGTAACLGTFFSGAGLIGWFISTYENNEGIHAYQVALREVKQTLSKWQRQLMRWDEQALKHLTAEQYMHQLPGLIDSYRKRADRYRNWFVTTQLITIFLSAAITSLSGGWLDRYFQIPWIIPVIGALISILTSLTLFFKFREKGTNLQQTADAMDWEHMACTLGIGHYKGMTKEVAQVELAEKAEALRQEQQKKQLQLEQSSHSEQKALQSTP